MLPGWKKDKWSANMEGREIMLQKMKGREIAGRLSGT